MKSPDLTDPAALVSSLLGSMGVPECEPIAAHVPDGTFTHGRVTAFDPAQFGDAAPHAFLSDYAGRGPVAGTARGDVRGGGGAGRPRATGGPGGRRRARVFFCAAETLSRNDFSHLKTFTALAGNGGRYAAYVSRAGDKRWRIGLECHETVALTSVVGLGILEIGDRR